MRANLLALWSLSVAMIAFNHVLRKQAAIGMRSRVTMIALSSYSTNMLQVRATSTAPTERTDSEDDVSRQEGIALDAHGHAGYVHVPMGTNNDTRQESTQQYDYKVIRELPHDEEAFTQGLTLHNGFLYESTGQYGLSELRKVDVESGSVLDSRKLPSNRFGEGMCIWKDKIIQLTWKSGQGYIWDLEKLERLTTFTYTTHRNNEAWGITHNNTHLFVSDGSSVIYVWDPETMQQKRKMVVRNSRGRTIDNINELEFVNGEILANVWFRKWIYRIDPFTGRLLGKIDFRGIYPESKNFGHEAVFNGIAVDQSSIKTSKSSGGQLDTIRLFVTGKLWPKLFEVQLLAK